MKSIKYILSMTLLLASSSCANNIDEIIDPPEEEEEIIASEILEEYFEEWDITIPYYQDVSNSETYRLLKNLVGSDYIRKKVVPINDYSHASLTPTAFNDFLLSNEDAIALHGRKNCISVLISTYLPLLKTYGADYKTNDLFYVELVLSSEMFLSKMNVKEKVQLMALALERIKYGDVLLSNFNIIISIMLSSNYTPFVENVKPMLIEWYSYHYFLTIDDNRLTPGLDTLPVFLFGHINKPATDLVTGYAKQFINDNKL